MMRIVDGENREVVEINEIAEILKKCDVIRVGMNGEDYPYVVPVNFGMKVENEKIYLYFHGARIGKKFELLTRDGRVCVEADIYSHMYEGDGYVDTIYESVIGYGICRLVEDREQKSVALKIMLESCGFPEHPIDECLGFDRTAMFEIELKEVSGKRNKG